MTSPARRLAALATGLGLFVAQEVPPTRQVPPASPQAATGVSFVDVTVAAGLDGFRHVSGGPDKRYLIETTGSGVALTDLDADGYADIYLVNASTIEDVRRGTPAPPAALFRNDGDGTFTDVTRQAGVANERWGQGVCAGDFDNDGHLDLYVTNFGPNRLYRSVDGRRYEDVAGKAAVDVGNWSTGCAFGDYDGDGWLDLYVAGYVDLDVDVLPPPPDGQGASEATLAPAEESPQGRVGMGASYSAGAAFCTYRGAKVMCGPLGLPGAPDHLFRNNGDGTFTDVTEPARVTDDSRRYGLGVAWLDIDDDGRLDLLVANDSGPNYVYRNLGDGTFEDISYPSGAALDGNGRPQAHMGIAVGDYDRDGRNDVHITNFADDFNVLYHNQGDASFLDVSYRTRIARPSVPFLSWGTDFFDYDNDGWLDLLVVNGHVYPAADRLDWNTSYAQRALLYRNLDGQRFEEVGAAAGPALTTPRVARGSAIGDIDNDGDVDVVVNTLDGPPLLARNDGSGHGHWLRVLLRGDPSRKGPKDAIGSVVWVTVGEVLLRGEVASGRGQLSQSDLRVHFGLGDATAITSLAVRWANGQTETYSVTGVDREVEIDQGSGVRERRAPTLNPEP